MVFLNKKLYKIIEDSLNEQGFFVDQFSDSKILVKLFKVNIISIIYMKFIFSDFNYESNMKTQIKRLYNTINVAYLILFENIIVNSNKKDLEIVKAISDKMSKMYKHHKPQKNLKHKDALNLISKQIELISNGIKQFSK